MVNVADKQSLKSFVDTSSAETKYFETLREEAKKLLEIRPFPTKRDEEWRFTDLKSISNGYFKPIMKDQLDTALNLDEYHLPEAKKSRLVFINGHYSQAHSCIEDLPDGVIVDTITNNENHPKVKEYLAKITNYTDDVFVPLNDLSFNDGTFIYVPKEVEIKQPIHILNVFTNMEFAYFATPRVLFVGEMYSKATIIEEHIGLAQNQYLNIPVNEFRLYSGAHVHHARIQRDSKQATHISRPIAMLDAHAEYHSYTICLGAKLFRNEPRVIQNAAEVDFTVDGLVLIDGDQIADTHSIMDHRYSYGNSHQLHKVVVNDQAHSIFNGKIFVAKDAQKIDSFQENRNLLISDDAKVNTKPQLEIFADDVRCSHGATIGQLQDEEVFYLQSRGLTEQKSRELLVYAFALESVESMAVKSVEELLLREVIAYTNRD